MKKLLLLIFLPMAAFAQFSYIPISADFASFKLSDSTCYVEIYISTYQSNIKYIKRDSILESNFSYSISILNNNELFKEGMHSYQNVISDTTGVHRYNQFLDVFGFELPFGKYQAKILMNDSNSKQIGEYIMDLELKEPPDLIYFSDIEFALEITKDSIKSLYSKNGLKVVPNPRNTYDIFHPLLYFYVEINNLSFSQDTLNQYEFSYNITDIKGDTLKSVPPKTKDILSTSVVEAGGLNVISLPGDTYFLNLSATDLKTNNKNSIRKKFVLHKPTTNDTEPVVETALPDVDEIYITLSNEELLNEFQIAKYIATDTEEEIFSSLSDHLAIRKFLTQFWRSRDRKGNLNAGASRAKFYDLVNFSNSNFSKFKFKGWKTDRGRVLISYGQPDEIDRYHNIMQGLPYEIWNYHGIEGGIIFVFSDLNGFGVFELIHSTSRREINNPDWKNIVTKTKSQDSNRNEDNMFR